MGKPRFKKSVKILTAVCAGSLFLILIVAAGAHQDKAYCSGLNITIDYNSGQNFINKAEVESKLNAIFGTNLLQRTLNAIDGEAIEQTLLANPYIKSAEVYATLDNQLNIEIEQIKPLVRVINKQHVNFYLSENGEVIPTSNNFTPRVLIATGKVAKTLKSEADTLVREQLITLAKTLNEDEFWSAMFEQVDVSSNQEFTLIPKIGSHEVLLGKIDKDLNAKLKVLREMYQSQFKNLGWEQYKKIDLRYKDKVYTTKR